jgi:hypothetical protein
MAEPCAEAQLFCVSVQDTFLTPQGTVHTLFNTRCAQVGTGHLDTHVVTGAPKRNLWMLMLRMSMCTDGNTRLDELRLMSYSAGYCGLSSQQRNTRIPGVLLWVAAEVAAGAPA